MKRILTTLVGLPLLFAGWGCTDFNDDYEPLDNPVAPDAEVTFDVYGTSDGYGDVPLSSIYKVKVSQNGISRETVVFQSTCPQWQLGYMDMTETDKYPLGIFEGRSISWTNFSFSGEVEVEVEVLDQNKVPVGSDVRILPRRYGIEPVVEGNKISFTLSSPGQCSVEIGSEGYKNGLMIFADPRESDAPSAEDPSYLVLDKASAQDVAAVSSEYSGLYFKPGVHDIGVYKVPANVKNIYMEGGAWVYGSLIMDGRSDVRIFGRGVLSSGRMKYRETHCIEAVNNSNRITLEGIVVADPKYFSVRLIGVDNKVSWIKVIGSWTYNCDGISAFHNSVVSNCFIWANDDNIKTYRDNVKFHDIVCWQLNNGGLIQMNWGGAQATGVEIRRVDLLHAEWNNSERNRGILSCVGDKYQAGTNGWSKNWIIEDLVTETPVSLVFRVSPYDYSPCAVDGLHLKDWDILYDGTFKNYMVGMSAEKKIKGVVFDNVKFNGTSLTSANWRTVGKFETDNIEEPTFK